MRLFIAVDVSPKVREAVAALLEDTAALSPDSKWVQVEKIHVTLVFLGHIDDARLPEVEAAVREVAARHAPMSLDTRGAGGFPSAKKPRVLWLGLHGDVAPLGEVKRELEEKLVPLGYEPEKRDFRPHLTLARAKEKNGDPRLARCVAALENVDLGPSPIRELVLYQSQLSPKGAKYTALLRAPFTGR